MRHPPFPEPLKNTLTRRNLARVLRTAAEPLDAGALAGILCGEGRVTPRHVARCERLLRRKEAAR